MNGRIKCENCGSRDTEITSSYRKRNVRKIECHTCGTEFKDYRGPECPSCESQNTVKTTKGVAPHKRRVIKCHDCGRNKGHDY